MTELLIQAIDLANVSSGMQAHQPVAFTGLNSDGIIQVVSGLVCSIEPDPTICPRMKGLRQPNPELGSKQAVCPN
jgi:hypothetical protein